MSRKAVCPSFGSCLTLALLACASVFTLAAPQVGNAQSSGPKLLKNPGFDWPAQTNGDVCATGWMKDNAITPHEWIPYWTCKNEQEKNQDQINRPPEFRVMTVEMASDRVRTDPPGASFFPFWALNRSMGLYQRVRSITPGARLRFSVWANLLTTDSDELPLSSSRSPGGLQARACIHTTGNVLIVPNLNDPAVVCGSWARYYDTWGELSVEATAAANEVVVIIDTTADYPVKHNDVHVDDASLVVISAGAAPAAPTQAQPSAPVVTGSDNTPRVIVKTPTANVRASPSYEGSIIASAQQGATFAVRAYTADKEWWQIEFAGGQNGVAYIHNSVVSMNSAAQAALGVAPGSAAQPAQPTTPQQTSQTIAGAPAQVIVNTGGSRLNVRGAPSSTGKILGKVANGANLEVKGVSPDKQWWRITYPGTADNTAWVMAQFVTPNAAAQQLAAGS
jgi:uncharacterized protein YgiM (DUF1202 family)